MRIVCERQRSKNRELRGYPDDTQPYPQYDLTSDVFGPAAIRVEKGEDAKANNGEGPADVVLGPIPIGYLDGCTDNHARWCDEHDHTKEVDAGSDWRRSLYSLEINGEII